MRMRRVKAGDIQGRCFWVFQERRSFVTSDIAGCCLWSDFMGTFRKTGFVERPKGIHQVFMCPSTISLRQAQGEQGTPSTSSLRPICEAEFAQGKQGGQGTASTTLRCKSFPGDLNYGQLNTY